MTAAESRNHVLEIILFLMKLHYYFFFGKGMEGTLPYWLINVPNMFTFKHHNPNPNIKHHNPNPNINHHNPNPNIKHHNPNPYILSTVNMYVEFGWFFRFS